MAAAKTPPDEEDPQKSPTQFLNFLTRVAVAQICQSVGFRGSHSFALQALTTISTLYLRSLAATAAACAASCGRTQCNVLDVVHALEELASPRGFPGASNVNASLLSSSTLTDLSKFVGATEELPFAKPMPRRIKSRLGLTLSARNLDSGGGRKSGSEIPRWLPDFPDMVSDCEQSMERKELHWEETWGWKGEIGERVAAVKMLKQEDNRRRMLLMRRDRVRFKIGVGKVKGKSEGQSDMRLKNGALGVENTVRLLNGKS